MSAGATRKIARRSKPADPELLDSVHRALASMVVKVPREPSTAQLRALFSEIRDHCNRVAGVLSPLVIRAARLRSDLVRVERALESEGALVLDKGEDFLGANTIPAKTARVKVMLQDLHDLRSEVKADLVLTEEALNHARAVNEELRYAFEEASRSLSSLELDYRIEHSRA